MLKNLCGVQTGPLIASGAVQAVVRYESYLNATAAVPLSTITSLNSAGAVVDQRTVNAPDLREKRFVSVGFNFIILEAAKLKLQTFYHHGLNSYYTTESKADGAGSIRTTNKAENFEHADDWFVIQLQIHI